MKTVRKRKTNTIYECTYVESRKMTDKLICSAGIDLQVEGHGGWGGMDGDRALTYIRHHV